MICCWGGVGELPLPGFGLVSAGNISALASWFPFKDLPESEEEDMAGERRSSETEQTL